MSRRGSPAAPSPAPSDSGAVAEERGVARATAMPGVADTEKATVSKNELVRATANCTSSVPPRSPTGPYGLAIEASSRRAARSATRRGVARGRVGVGRDVPVRRAQVQEGLLDLAWRRKWPARLVEGRRRRSRAARPSTCQTTLCRSGRGGRHDALAGCDEVDVGAVVAEVRERVVPVERAPVGAGVSADAARKPVGVGECRDGDDLVVGRRHVERRAAPTSSPRPRPP